MLINPRLLKKASSMNLTNLECVLPNHAGDRNLAERNRLVTDEGMIELAKRVEFYRKKSGILQAELADQLGVTQPMISRIEKGLARLNGELIVKLASIFSISTDELLGAKTKPLPETAVGRRWLKRLQRIDGLSKREQDALALIIDAFLAKPKSKNKAS
jgi:transcriptional regulator with XRE-family HTH domain